MSLMRFTILGCGSSGGVPRLGGKWGDCDPTNPKNRRQRCSLLVQRIGANGITRTLVDTSPDLRAQLLAADVGLLDGVVYTHPHADHVNGLDDLRMIFHNRASRLDVWADDQTRDALLTRFGYAFKQPDGSEYPPILNLRPMGTEIVVEGDGGAIVLTPFPAIHGRIATKGFRVLDLAYLPDVSEMRAETWRAVSSLDCWIIDSLRRRPHPSHTHFARTLQWIDRAAPQRAILTNMHIDLDYAQVMDETPDNVEPAYDGLTIEYEI